MSQVLRVLAEQLPLIQKCFPDDVCLALFDTEKLLAQVKGESFQLKMLELGTPLEKMKGSTSYKAVRTGKVVKEEKGKELFGVPYIGIACPIYEDGKVAGVLTSMTSTEKVATLKRGADELSSMVQKTSSLSEAITEGTGKTNEQIQHLARESAAFTETMKEIYDILNVIKEVSAKTNLIGLNAAIEATRAGEYGKGFTVVANEIRKLAEYSKRSVENIDEQLKNMESKIQVMNETIQNIASFTQKHSESADEFSTIFEKISQISLNLHEHSKI